MSTLRHEALAISQSDNDVHLYTHANGVTGASYGEISLEALPVSKCLCCEMRNAK